MGDVMDNKNSVSENHISDLELQLLGYRLTTAEIIYRLPDHPDLLQMFLWQQLDLDPQFPRLHRFLEFWEKNIDGQLYHVKVAHAEGLDPQDLQHTDFEFHC